MLDCPWGFERCGKCPGVSGTRPPKLNTRISAVVDSAKEEIPEINNVVGRANREYEWPGERFAPREVDSLIIHADRYFKPSTEACEPNETLKQRILYEAEKAYGDHCVWELPDDYLDRTAFDRAVRRLDMTSSPGIPYMREATTNGQWLGHNGVTCDAFQLNRLWHDVQLVFAKKWENLVRVFIKQEPHKKTKVEEGRWRLIMAASLPVQVAWHMMFDYLNDLEIDKSYFIPSQQGICLVGGGWKRYRQSWVSEGLESGLDKSAWDWTCPHWILNLDLEFRFRLGRGRLMREWRDRAQYLYDRMFVDPILVTSDGSMFRQVVPGIMKSGCVNTISTNSHAQVFVHVAVCADGHMPVHPLPRACGDDTLQHAKHTGDLSLYAKYGVIIKSASDAMEFVGHEFTSSGPHPLYMAKHIKKLQYVEEENLSQYLDSMARMYVHTRYFYVWQDLAKRLGVLLPLSREAYTYWYDYQD